MELGRIFRRHPRHNLIYLLNFLVSFHFFLLVYINSSYLATFVSDRIVGTIYIIGAVLGAVALWTMTNVLTRYGNFRALVFLTILEFFVALGLAFPAYPLFAVLFFIAHMAVHMLILFSLDVFLEASSLDERETGGVRGAFLTMQNLAIILAPLTIGIILTNGDYWRAYALSSLFLIPFLYIVIRKLRTFKDPLYEHLHLRSAVERLLKYDELRKIFYAQLLLRIFFAWMIIYTPIYLHQHIGFSWGTIGVMLTIALLPYLFIEWPAGKLADTKLGEKELLGAGFAIAALGAGFLPFIGSAPVIAWIAVLLLARTGAALVEIMTESYFFKHVRGDETNTISLFRIARPLAYIGTPLIATIVLFLTDFRFLFLVLAAIMLAGVYLSTTLRDTR